MQRGPVMTFAASENSARERAARSATPENALGGRNSTGAWDAACPTNIWVAARPDNNASAIEFFRIADIADTFSIWFQTPEIERL
jgi:hypothetical protein